MPLRKEPDTLFNLSVEKLAFWFKGSWKCGEECVPISVLDDIFNRNPSLEKTVFCKKVVSLKLNVPNLFDGLPVDIFNEILPKVAAAFVCCRINRFCLICLRKLLAIIMTKRLKHWDILQFLRREWYITSRIIGIKSVILYQIPTIKNIVYLRLGCVCDNSILRCVGENCHIIEYLDIEDSEVTDEGLMYLIPSENSAGCPKLKELILGENEYRIKISSHTVALLMRSLADIVYINYGNMKSALLEVSDINESQKSLVLQLKRLDYIVPWPYTSWNFEEIIRLSKLCPNLEQLKIRFIEEKDVLALKHFPCLSQLQLHYIGKTKFPVAEAKQYFKEYCKHITSLIIICDSLDTTCFSLLSKHCPSLAKLVVYCRELGASGPFNRDEERNFKILSSFTLHFCNLQDDSNLVTRDLLYSLLKSTNRLTEVRLMLPPRCLSHQDLQFLLDVVDMHLLLSLRISTFGDPKLNLTMESVYLILEKCPLLKSFGCLKHWNVVDSDIDKLKKDMEYSNYDIEIHLS